MAEEVKEDVVAPPEEEEEEGEESEAEESKAGFFSNIKAKFGKILIYIIGAILVIIISIGASMWVGTRLQKEKVREIGGKMYIPPPEPLMDFPLDVFTVNIQGDDDEPHFIRVNMALGYPERAMTLAGELSKRRTQILHIINMILSRKHKKELDTPEGKQNLIIEIKEQINQILQKGKIKAVFFKAITVM